MKFSGKVIAAVSIAAACGLAVFFLQSNGPEAEETPSASQTVAKKERASKQKGLQVRKHVQTTDEKQPEAQASAGKPVLRMKGHLVADETLSHLTKEQRADLEKIQDALDEDDFNGVRAVVQKMQSSKDWPDKVPIELRKEAMNALSWFGIKALPEITGFLADSNPEVVAEAVTAYENIMSDANGDGELQQVVLAAAYSINDADSMESILMEVNNMRPSVAVATLKAVWESGTAAAKKVLPETIEAFTGEDNIKTPADLDAWYNDPSGDNKDADDAEEEFGAKPEND